VENHTSIARQNSNLKKKKSLFAQFALLRDFTDDGGVHSASVIVDNYERSVLVIVNDNTPPLDHPIVSKILKKSKSRRKKLFFFFF
jgi:hypothetical protein